MLSCQTSAHCTVSFDPQEKVALPSPLAFPEAARERGYPGSLPF
jgi:hypothetical protein